jgi:hypothetical protein
MHFPRQIIYICFVIPVEMRWVMALYLIWDLHPVLLELSGDRVMSGVAHAAHLGGLAFGFLYYKFQWRLAALGEAIHWPRWLRRRPAHLRIAPETIPFPDADTEHLDQLLQKISLSGQASLTEEERELLRKASERLRSRRQNGGF